MTRLLRPVFLLFFLMTLPGAQNGYALSDTDPNPDNYTDKQGLRQGYWQITGSMTIEEGYSDEQLVAEGEYVDNQRQGLWTKYYPTGGRQSEITYRNNRPYGKYQVFYPNGQVEETGVWKSNKNTGDFKRFHKNGKPAQKFYFDSKGKRHGTQQYFHENGQLQLRVDVEHGTAHGEYMSYHSDGSPKVKKRITNGQVEEGTLKTFAEPTTELTDSEIPELPRRETQADNADRPNLEEFNESGYNTLYNQDLQVTQVGVFYNGRLWDGKWYRYDRNGLLNKVEVYKKGRFAGYAVIDDLNQ
jgi:antitoxin component YwqK of YwqJK toxin-antitoxin module